jgi:putative spermidine/putrescine transport system permease protein
MSGDKRPRSFYVLAAFFAAYMLFLYGPMFAIYILSFQGPDGGLTFPMNGVSLTWFGKLFSGAGIVDIGAAFKRSLMLGLLVMVLTLVLSVAAGMAFRKPFRGASLLFYTAIASLIMPSIITSLGIALEFRLLDDVMNKHAAAIGLGYFADGWTTGMGLFTSGLGAHLTWTLPFGLLIMFAIFNRFDGRLEEAARDLGATRWQTFRHVVLPIIAPSVVGIGLFGFTLSWDELARSSQAIGAVNTLPLDLQGLTTTVTNPDIYALGTVISAVSFTVIALALGTIHMLNKRQAAKGSDAGKGLV